MRHLLLLCALTVCSRFASAQLGVVSIDPPQNANNRAPNDFIVVDFDRPVMPSSLSNIRIFGNMSGPIAGTQSLENGNTRVRFRPERAYFAGELIGVSLNENLQAQDGSFLRTQGFVASFRVKTAPAPMQFTPIASFDVSPGVFSRIYGGQTCDLDGDDFLDLAVVSEISNDVRVFLSNHDATGSFGGMTGVPNPVGNSPSPNESADLNADGWIDMVTCEYYGGTASVLLGNGDGTFQHAVLYSMSTGGAFGMALFDADGDGRTDVAMTGGDTVNLRLGDGNGGFGPMTSISTAVSNDYGLTAADMDNDGIVDLVVGGISGGIMVLKSNGNGTFTPKPAQLSGGHCWMITNADVNNDGNIDVSVANGGAARGSILLGNGDGTFQLPFSTPPVGQTAATDLGDLDGDGDIDWVLSSYGGGVYQVWKNQGNGSFVLDQTMPSVQNPACAALVDIDGDRDLDMVQFDETSDFVTIMENGALDAPTFCYGTGSACPCGNGGAAGHGCENSVGTGGGLLLAQGRASISNDSLALNIAGLPPTSNLVYFQGTAASGGGVGVPFYDGLLCAGGAIKRLAAGHAVNGFAGFGSGNVGDPLLSIAGGISAGGSVVYYQVWYRNSGAFCTSGTSNTSNGIKVTWTL